MMLNLWKVLTFWQKTVLVLLVVLAVVVVPVVAADLTRYGSPFR